MPNHSQPPEPPTAVVDPAREPLPYSRLGLVLFTFYFLIYGGFVATAVISSATLGQRLGGITLAVWWGMVLIVLPLLLAMVYVRWAEPADGASAAPGAYPPSSPQARDAGARP